MATPWGYLVACTIRAQEPQGLQGWSRGQSTRSIAAQFPAARLSLRAGRAAVQELGMEW